MLGWGVELLYLGLAGSRSSQPSGLGAGQDGQLGWSLPAAVGEMRIRLCVADVKPGTVTDVGFRSFPRNISAGRREEGTVGVLLLVLPTAALSSSCGAGWSRAGISYTCWDQPPSIQSRSWGG